MHPAKRRSPVASRLEAVEQGLEIPLQLLCILRRGLPVHSRRAIFSRALERFPEELDVNVMRQSPERHSRHLPSQCRYPSKSR